MATGQNPDGTYDTSTDPQLGGLLTAVLGKSVNEQTNTNQQTQNTTQQTQNVQTQGQNTSTTQGTQGTTGTISRTNDTTQQTNQQVKGTADIAGLQDVLQRQLAGITPEQLSAIFTEGAKAAPQLIVDRANALGARTDNNSAVATSLRDLQAQLTAKAADINAQMLAQAGQTAGQIAQATRSTQTTGSNTTSSTGQDVQNLLTTNNSTTVADQLQKTLNQTQGVQTQDQIQQQNKKMTSTINTDVAKTLAGAFIGGVALDQIFRAATGKGFTGTIVDLAKQLIGQGANINDVNAQLGQAGYPPVTPEEVANGIVGNNPSAWTPYDNSGQNSLPEMPPFSSPDSTPVDGGDVFDVGSLFADGGIPARVSGKSMVRHAYADGGRVEPKVGTRSPLPVGEGGGGLSNEAVMRALLPKPAASAPDKPGTIPRVENALKMQGYADGGTPNNGTGFLPIQPIGQQQIVAGEQDQGLKFSDLAGLGPLLAALTGSRNRGSGSAPPGSDASTPAPVPDTGGGGPGGAIGSGGQVATGQVPMGIVGLAASVIGLPAPVAALLGMAVQGFNNAAANNTPEAAVSDAVLGNTPSTQGEDASNDASTVGADASTSAADSPSVGDGDGDGGSSSSGDGGTSGDGGGGDGSAYADGGYVTNLDGNDGSVASEATDNPGDDPQDFMMEALGITRGSDPGSLVFNQNAVKSLYRAMSTSTGAQMPQGTGPNMNQSRPAPYGGDFKGPPPVSPGRTEAPSYGNGGKIVGPGTGTSDSVPGYADGAGPIRVSNGEYIVPADVVQAVGSDALDRLVAMFHTPVNRG